MQYVLKMFDFDLDVGIDAVHINNIVDSEVKIIRCEVHNTRIVLVKRKSGLY